MIITFLGHEHISMNDRIKETVKAQIRSLLTGKPITCYLGGYGDFDDICARACKELKQKYDIETVYVAPYVTLSEQEKIKEMQRCGLCDTSIYPPIENTPPKFAISKRNEWMVTHADVIIAYVNRSYGGAYQSLQTAKRRKKKIINICELL
jgi:uncharacterized phage-like protein YoqJ